MIDISPFLLCVFYIYISLAQAFSPDFVTQKIRIL